MFYSFVFIRVRGVGGYRFGGFFCKRLGGMSWGFCWVFCGDIFIIFCDFDISVIDECFLFFFFYVIIIWFIVFLIVSYLLLLL